MTVTYAIGCVKYILVVGGQRMSQFALARCLWASVYVHYSDSSTKGNPGLGGAGRDSTRHDTDTPAA